MKRQAAEQSGRDAEARAATCLRLKGWSILGQRVKTRLGEIDLIAKRGTTIVFIEVKWRAKSDELDHAVDEYRLQRVAVAVESVVHSYATNGLDILINVILLAPVSFPLHIVNAWQP